MTTTERPMLPIEAQPYVAAVRELLWALPADERDELLEDLSSHLAELAAEDGPPLRERLGTPSTYAADFVASAGVEAPEPRRVTMPRLSVPPTVLARWAALRPAWLVLRSFAIVFGGASLLNNNRMFQNVGPVEIVALGVISVAFIGLSQRLTGAWDKLATLAGVIAVLVVIGALSNGRQYIYVDNSGSFGPSGVLMRGDGTPVSNIWAYDVDGNPIDVFLFDQNGRPLDDTGADGYDERTGDQLHSSFRTDANGSPVPNLYPREQSRVSYDEYGRPTKRRDRAPSLSTPQVTREPSTTSTTAPATTTTTTAPAGPASTP